MCTSSNSISILCFSFPEVDNIPPSITCSENVQQSVPCGSTNTGTQINFLATATDNCGAANIIYSSVGSTNFASQTQSSATMNVGFSTVTATATDTSGRTVTCTTQVTITECMLTTGSPESPLIALYLFFFSFLFYLGVNSDVIICSPMKPRAGIYRTVWL